MASTADPVYKRCNLTEVIYSWHSQHRLSHMLFAHLKVSPMYKSSFHLFIDMPLTSAPHSEWEIQFSKPFVNIQKLCLAYVGRKVAFFHLCFGLLSGFSSLNEFLLL